MKPVGVLRFLGTNCDADVLTALDSLNVKSEYVWWADRFDPKKYQGLILPGGFSYGDYLRAGALAARAPAMDDLRIAAKAGLPILGICNGFQILCEAGLLEGALTKNISRKFQDEWMEVFDGQKKYRLPIAHSLGRYLAPEKTIQKMFDSKQVWLTYSKNPNGSLSDIAGLSNGDKNVRALMPHPERAMHDWMGSSDGRTLFGVFL